MLKGACPYRFNGEKLRGNVESTCVSTAMNEKSGVEDGEGLIHK